MSLSVHQGNLTKTLFFYADLVETSNKLGLLNEAVDAENLFCEFLNNAFGWQLKNSNQFKNNQDTFDLLDNENGIAVQVTSNKNYSAKLKKTIASFKKRKSSGKIKSLIIIFISKKCPPSLLTSVKQNKILIEAFDIPKLLKKVYYENKTISKIGLLSQMWLDVIMPIWSNQPNGPFDENLVNTSAQSKVTIKKNQGLVIVRNELVENLFSFTQNGNGLLVGDPGVGKSFSIEELKKLCLSRKIQCFVIRLNELQNGTDDEINKELKVNRYWITNLKKLPVDQQLGNSILIFDAFDTAKDEKLKSAILKHIGNAIKDLQNNWNILVSCRTYDAQKSTRLRELFPESNSLRQATRAFTIPQLSDIELEKVLSVNAKLNLNVQKARPELKNLIKTPYFLKLFETVISTKESISHSKLITINSEERLLEHYWQSKVADTTDKDIFLRHFTGQLVLKENLSCPKTEIITLANSKIYDDLISLGVIVENSVTKKNITYSHNILFDFAISKYLLDENPETLIEFITANQKLPFLFRQSFIYFYEKLWSQHKDIFWKHYLKIRPINSALFRLYHQTILNYVLGSLYNSIKELDPIFKIIDPEEKGLTIRKLLEGLRFISKGVIRDKDFYLFHRISENMHVSFLWEFGFLIQQAIKKLNENQNQKQFSLIARTASNYINFVLSERKNPVNKFLTEMNGGQKGIQNLCDTYSYSLSGSKKIIKKILEILKEEDFPIGFFFQLADQLEKIFSHDRSFAVEVYKAIYYRNENSDKVTQLGNSPVLSLRSYRRQDFDSVHHKLEKDFAKLIALYPDELIPVGIEIINKFGVEKKYYRGQEKPFKFILYGVKANLTADFTYYDSEHDKEYGPMSHLENIYNLMNSLAASQKLSASRRSIKIIASHGRASTIWRRLIKLYISYPKELVREAYALLQVPAFYICDETVYEAAELIKVIWQKCSLSQKKSIEKAIWSIDSVKDRHLKIELKESRLLRLLSCIPLNELNFKKSKEFIADKGQKENEPLLTQPRIQRHHSSPEEKMREVGVDSNNVFDIKIYNLIEKIQPFNTKYDHNNTDNPLRNEFAPLIKIIEDLFKFSKSGAIVTAKLKASCDYEISTFAKLVSRHGKKLSKKNFNFVFEIANYYLGQVEYMSATYEAGDIKDKHGFFTPGPRSSSAQVFVQLLGAGNGNSIVNKVIELMSDNIRIVRFKAAHGLSYMWHYHRNEFWDVIIKRCNEEGDALCLHRLIHSINYDDIIRSNQKIVETCALRVLETINLAEDDARHELWDTYVGLILRLYLKHDSSAALEIINSNLDNKGFVRNIIFDVMQAINPHDPVNGFFSDADKFQGLLNIVTNILKFRFAAIKRKGLRSAEIQDDFEVIDLTIQQLFFRITDASNRKEKRNLAASNKYRYYTGIKPLLSYIVEESSTIESGFMVAHTGYYFMQLLNNLISLEPGYVLKLATSVVNYAAANGFTYDQSTLAEVVKLTETILADHKELLNDKGNFNNLITILDLFANSGWQEALELTWRLKDIF